MVTKNTHKGFTKNTRRPHDNRSLFVAIVLPSCVFFVTNTWYQSKESSYPCIHNWIASFLKPQTSNLKHLVFTATPFAGRRRAGSG